MIEKNDNKQQQLGSGILPLQSDCSMEGSILLATYEIAKQLNEMLAIVDISKDTFIFEYEPYSYYAILKGRTIPLSSLTEYIHRNDLRFFAELHDYIHSSISHSSAEELHSKALAFEVRLRDGNGVYRRSIFRFRILNEQQSPISRLALLIYPFPGINESMCNHSTYLIDTDTKSYQLLFDRHEAISATESKVLRLMRQQLNSKEIAATLFISPNTVRKHKNNIYGKLGVTSEAQALFYAHYLGIL